MNLTDIQMELLLAIYTSEDKPIRYADFAKKYKLKNYEVSRISTQLGNMGMIDKSEPRRPALTEAGIHAAKRIFDKLHMSETHMRYEGVHEADIRHNALIWALNCTDTLFDAIERIDQHYQPKGFFNGNSQFTGAELCEKIGEGLYELPFMFYKMFFDKENNPHNNYSMANDGFRKYCEMRIHKGKGHIVLYPVMLSSDKTADGSVITGKAANFQYFNGEKYVEAQMARESLIIPMDNFMFRNMGEDVTSRILHGSIETKMTCSNGGQGHGMADMSAILSVFLH